MSGMSRSDGKDALQQGNREQRPRPRGCEAVGMERPGADNDQSEERRGQKHPSEFRLASQGIQIEHHQAQQREKQRRAAKRLDEQKEETVVVELARG